MIKFTLDDKEVRKALAQLPPKLNEKVRKRALRSVFVPARESHRSLWKSAPYKGRALHRRAIAFATKLDIRRNGSGPSAPLMFTLGVQYGRKGGSRAKGRQRVWHLLENGFRHRQAGRIPGSHRSFNWVRRNSRRMLTALQEAILIEAAELMGGNGAK